MDRTQWPTTIALSQETSAPVPKRGSRNRQSRHPSIIVPNHAARFREPDFPGRLRRQL